MSGDPIPKDRGLLLQRQEDISPRENPGARPKVPLPVANFKCPSLPSSSNEEEETCSDKSHYVDPNDLNGSNQLQTDHLLLENH